jgi:hypothetical protein
MKNSKYEKWHENFSADTYGPKKKTQKKQNQNKPTI